MIEDSIKGLLMANDTKSVNLGVLMSYTNCKHEVEDIATILSQNEVFVNSLDTEEICTMCEESILFCKRSDSTGWSCEGGRCKEANEMFIQSYIEDNY